MMSSSSHLTEQLSELFCPRRLIIYDVEINFALSSTSLHNYRHGVYKTAYRWWKAGKLDAYQMDTGTVIVRDPLKVSATNVALYARVA